MIIDIHGHVTAPIEVYAWKAQIIAGRGNPMSPEPKLSDERIEDTLAEHIELLRGVGTDVQLISPRPYHAMHSLEPTSIVRRYTTVVNDVIARQCGLFPDLFVGVGGLPQTPGAPLDAVVAELERCVRDLGFVAANLNPDPTEGGYPFPPGLGDPYWYPLYEKAIELDVPLIVHAAGCCSPRESYTLHFINEESIAIVHLLDSDVFERYPALKLVIVHGGGAIPYHMARFDAQRLRNPAAERYRDSMRRLWYDTCVYSAEGLELLFKTMGPDRCLFGTEKPGTGSAVDPDTGRMLDDLKPLIEELSLLNDNDRALIFEDNARRLFRLELPATGTTDKEVGAWQTSS